MSNALSLADLESYDPHSPRKGKERRFLCPLCGHGKPRDRAHRSFALNTLNGAWICHRCGEKGLLTEFWTNNSVKGKSRDKRLKAAVTQAFAVRSNHKIKKEATAADIKGREIWEASRPLEGTPGAAYLEGRGLRIDIANDSGVRFSSNWDGRPAVLFPISDRQGELVAINARFVDGRTNLRTQNAGPKSLGVFTTPEAIFQSPVAVVEAPIDALSLWLCGIPSIALIGTSWPEWLPSALAFKPVLVATDADASGDGSATKLMPLLNTRGAQTVRLRPLGGKDWNELLVNIGTESLRAELQAYSQTANDEIRVDTSWTLLKTGRIDEARFIASLIEDAYTREAYRLRMRRARLCAYEDRGAKAENTIGAAGNRYRPIRPATDALPLMNVVSKKH